MYHSTSAGLCVVNLAQEGSPLDPTESDGAPGSLPPLLYPDNLGICSLVTLCVSSSVPEGMSHGRKPKTKAAVAGGASALASPPCELAIFLSLPHSCSP